MIALPTPTQWETMQAISRQECRNVETLARVLGIQVEAARARVRRMTEQGFLERGSRLRVAPPPVDDNALSPC